MKKKIYVMVTTGLMAIALAGCGGAATPSNESTSAIDNFNFEVDNTSGEEENEYGVASEDFYEDEPDVNSEMEGLSIEQVTADINLAVKKKELFYKPLAECTNRRGVVGADGYDYIWAEDMENVLIISKSQGDELVTFKEALDNVCTITLIKNEVALVPVLFRMGNDRVFSEMYLLDDVTTKCLDGDVCNFFNDVVIEEINGQPAFDFMNTQDSSNSNRYLIGEVGDAYTIGYYKGTTFEEVHGTCNAIQLRIGEEKDLPIAKTKLGYFTIPLDDVPAGRYLINMFSTSYQSYGTYIIEIVD